MIPRGLCAAKAPPEAGPSVGDFFSRLEALASGSSEAVLFLPRLWSFMETLAPSARMGSVGGPRPPALSSTVSSFRGSGQGVVWSIFSNTGFSKPSRRGAKHRIIFAFVSQSWSKSKLSKITSNKRQCVQLEDFVLVRRRCYCSGPRPR